MNENIEALLKMILAANIEQIASRDFHGQPMTGGSRRSYAQCEKEAFDRVKAIAK